MIKIAESDILVDKIHCSEEIENGINELIGILKNQYLKNPKLNDSLISQIENTAGNRMAKLCSYIIEIVI